MVTSLLGAVRHQGFIPWDDDLDVMVNRENYEKIRSLIGGNLCLEHGTPEAIWIDRIRLIKHDKEAVKPTLDVFIIDNAPDGFLARKMRVLMIRALQGMLKKRLVLNKGPFIYKAAILVTYLAGCCFPRKVLMDWYNRISKLSNKRQTERKACYNDNFYDVQKLYHNDILSGFMTVPFEDAEACITKEYHQALVDKFCADYMTLPPESERVPKHL